MPPTLRADVIPLLEEPEHLCEFPLRPRPVGCPVPLTAVQRRVWNYLNEHKRPTWRMCATADHVFGALDISLLKSCIEAVVLRHESLRTGFVAEEGIPWQRVDEHCEPRFDLVDLSRMSCIDKVAQATHLANEFVQEKVDISTDPLFAARIFRLSHREHVLILAADHVISDGPSTGILSNEVWILYSQAKQGLSFGLPRLPVQFPDYAVWQSQTHSSWIERHEAYWRGRLTNVSGLQLPLYGDLAKVESPVGVWLELPLGVELSARLRILARRERTFLAIVVFAVYVAVLSRWCNQRDFIVMFVSDGRARPELANMIGFLTEMFYLRVELFAGDRFHDVVKRINHEFQSAYDHQDFGRVPDIIPACTTDIGFNWVSPEWRSAHVVQCRGDDTRIEPMPFVRKPGASRFGSFFYDSRDGITWSVEYRPDLFAASTIRRFSRNLQLFSEVVTQHPVAEVTSIPIEW